MGGGEGEEGWSPPAHMVWERVAFGGTPLLQGGANSAIKLQTSSRRSGMWGEGAGHDCVLRYPGPRCGIGQPAATGGSKMAAAVAATCQSWRPGFHQPGNHAVLGGETFKCIDICSPRSTVMFAGGGGGLVA